MVETEPEVEKVLREIRERVRNENNAPIYRSQDASDKSEIILNGDAPEPREISIAPNADALREAANALLRIKMNLATTGRAWSSLPPIGSYRSGILSRVELRLKRLIKRATNWFTFEQVNFNSAAHQSLCDLHAAFAAHEQALEILFQTLSLNGANSASSEQIQIIQNQTRAQIEELQNEMRERIQNVLDEHRVCYKQLALQTNESAVIADNARHDFEQRLAALENIFKRRDVRENQP